VTLVDTSSWVHYLRRRGDAAVAERVSVLLENGEAPWCPPVRLELWNGVGDEGDRRILRDFERTLPELPVTEDVWTTAFALAERCRRAGKTAPAIDVLIGRVRASSRRRSRPRRQSFRNLDDRLTAAADHYAGR
jgi:predicted nucleic acid-binding protein